MILWDTNHLGRLWNMQLLTISKDNIPTTALRQIQQRAFECYSKGQLLEVTTNYVQNISINIFKSVSLNIAI
jgi:hypothetical protein